MLETICQKILERAKHAGAEEADVLGIKGTSTSIEVRNQTLEQIERSEGTEFGLRVFMGKRQAIVSGSDSSDTAIKFMAERAVDMAKAAPIDPYCGLAEKSQLARFWNINKFELSDDRDEPQPDELENIAKGKNLKVLELEGVEAQLSIFDAIPIEGQVELIFNALNDLEQGKKNFIEMQKTYANQNLEEMCGFAIKGFLEEYSVLFLDQRNKKWIETMERLMLEDSTFFAVGAGHLCGDNGLVALLGQKGYQIKVIYL